MFHSRSLQKELIDLGEAYYNPIEYQESHQLLFKINKLLGIYRDTLTFLNKNSIETLLDVGCGTGEFIKQLSHHFQNIQFIGIDNSAAAIEEASKNNSTQNLKFYYQDLSVTLPKNIDVITATLVLHHLTNQQIIDFLKTAQQYTNKYVVINDLHRHPIAYYFYKIVTQLFCKNRLIQHDGALSILRSFKRNEIQALLHAANIKKYKIRWRFPFRWQIIIWK